jgi:hypothetical protein
MLPYPKFKHRGIHHERTKHTPLEAVFAQVWEDANKVDGGEACLLMCLMGESRKELTQRDADVAATIFQWLGSPVGRTYVYQALASAGLQLRLPTGLPPMYDHRPDLRQLHNAVSMAMEAEYKKQMGGE